MAAGLGFKDFVTGEVLTAADVDGYLMQGVWVFASAAARDAAVTAPSEGNFAYLKDTNVTTYYTGSAWANLDTTGMTNPMTTTGDTIYSSSGSTPARLGIGSTGNVLTVAGGVPTWAAPAGGGKVLQVVSATGANGVSTSSASNVDTGLTVTITPSSATSKVLVMTWHAGYVRNGNSSITGMLGSSNLLRGATSIEGTYFGVENYSSSNNKINYTNWTFMQLDAPATTSATTYKTQYAIITGTLSAINEGFIVAMEIGA